MLKTFRIHYILLVVMIVGMVSCSPLRFVPDGKYMLTGVTVESDSDLVDASTLVPYVQQKPNSKWFSLFKIPLAIYSLSGRDTTKWINRTIQKLGEKPVVFDTLLADRSANNLLMAMQGMGFLHSSVTLNSKARGKKLKAIYTLHPGKPFTIGKIDVDIQDSSLVSILSREALTIYSGQTFTTTALDNERRRITNLLTNNGYYRFHKDFIQFDADTIAGSDKVDLTMHILPYKATADASVEPHPHYYINKVQLKPTLLSKRVNLRKKVLNSNVKIKEGEDYSAEKLTATYNNMARLSAVKYSNVRLQDVGLAPDGKNHLLDADITIDTSKPSTISFQPEGTNTAGDLGAAAVLTYENRNFLRGSEVLSIQARAAFEAITGLEGYQNQDYEEYGLQAKLLLPHYSESSLSTKSTEFSVAYNLQNRPEFHRRVLSAAWRYRWGSRPSIYDGSSHSWRIDIIDLNYIRMPWISETFKHDYIDSLSNRNAILKYNYEDLFILKVGVGFSYSDAVQSLRLNIETAGNVLNAGSKLFGANENDQGQHTLLGIAFAQYAKFDFDYARHIPLDRNNTLALHAALGIAYPYGNSTVLPFEKRYFSGGANSLRGWGVREIGPGGYKGSDGRIDFINHTGDLKLDLSAELRTKLFWKFAGALFVDAGNIWTLRKYNEQPDGQLRFKTFLKQMAASYGLGLRLNLDYFIIRVDCGMKAVNPVYNTSKEHFPILHPRLSRDFAFHFAVGMPF